MEVLQYAQEVYRLEVCRKLNGNSLGVLLLIYQEYRPERVPELQLLLTELNREPLHRAIQPLDAYRVLEQDEPEVNEHCLFTLVVRDKHLCGRGSELADVTLQSRNPVKEPGDRYVRFKLVPNSSVVIHVEALGKVMLHFQKLL